MFWVNPLLVLLLAMAFFSIQALNASKRKYLKLLLVTVLGYGTYPLIIFLIPAVPWYFGFTRSFFGRPLIIETALALSLPITFLILFYQNKIGEKLAIFLEKILAFWLLHLFVFSATLNALVAFYYSDRWVIDAWRSFLILALLVLLLRSNYYLCLKEKYLVWIKRLCLVFSVFTLISFANFVFEIQYNFYLDAKLVEAQLDVNHSVTEDRFNTDVSDNLISRFAEYQSVIGKPDTVVSSYEFLNGGQVEKYQYCLVSLGFKECRGYQVIVRDGWVTNAYPYWGPHSFKQIEHFLYENWFWNRFFGTFSFKDFT